MSEQPTATPAINISFCKTPSAPNVKLFVKYIANEAAASVANKAPLVRPKPLNTGKSSGPVEKPHL